MDGVYLHLLPFPALLLYGAQETSVLITFDSEVNVAIWTCIIYTDGPSLEVLKNDTIT